MADSEPVAHELVGVAEGEEVVNVHGEATGETVVYEYDESGEVIGWHKVPLEKK